VIFSGCGVEGDKSCRFNDIFKLDISSLVWKKLALNSSEFPTNRGGSNLVIIDMKAYVFGGFAGKQLNDFWCFDFSTDKWSLVETVESSVQLQGRSVGCAVRFMKDSIFVFGGEREASASGHEGPGSYFDDSYIFNTKEKRWKAIQSSTGPSARGWFAAASLNDQVFVFGGYNGKARINDLWRFRE